MFKRGVWLLLLLSLIGFGCVSTGKTEDRELLFQTSTLNAILEGVYDGELTLDELKEYGDFGIGTFNGLNGELILLDGQIYQVKADGKVYSPAGDTKTPYAAATWFDSDNTRALTGPLTMDQFKEVVLEEISTENIFYAIKFSGVFTYVKTRSVPGQAKPYPPLVEVTKNQPEFEFSDIFGTVVGFFCPPYTSGVTVPEFHLHFLNGSATGGGHLLDFTLTEGTLEIDAVVKFYMELPESEEFFEAAIKEDSSEDIEEAEK